MWYFIMIMCAIMMFLLILYLYRMFDIHKLESEWKEEHHKEMIDLIEKIEEYERRDNMQELTKQCENEDIAKELLLRAKDNSDEISKRDLLEGILEQRKNLYVNA